MPCDHRWRLIRLLDDLRRALFRCDCCGRYARRSTAGDPGQTGWSTFATEED